jgi:amidase
MDLTGLSAAELASRIRDRAITSVQAVESYLTRIERYNPMLNAIVRFRGGDARADAQRADAALARGEWWGPMHGVPFTLSDVQPTASLEGSVGTKASEQLPEGDGIVAGRLRGAGGILIGKTNASVSLRIGSEQFGRTANPYDRSRAAGGAAGGAAAAVAARMTPFDVGLDSIGSVRIPAHFCGVFGFRPTLRRLPSGDVVSGPPGTARLDRSFGTAGIVARSLGDLGLLLRLLSGDDPRDPEVAPVPVVDPQRLSAAGLRVAVISSFESSPTSAEVAGAVAALADALSGAGAQVETASPFPLEEMLAALQRNLPVFLSLVRQIPVPPPSPLPDAVHPPTPYEMAILADERDRYIFAFERFMANYDAILCPPASVTAPPNGELRFLEVDDATVPFSSIEHWSLLPTYVGAPSLVVPVALSPNGLPIGAQLIGRRWTDERLIGLGSVVTALVGVPDGPSFE